MIVVMKNSFLYGVCYYPEHWQRRRHAADVARMAEAGFDVVRVGESAWGYFEPEEGKFQFDLFDDFIELCRKHGLKVIFGTPTYCAPAWVAAKYPEVLRWNFQRIPMKHGSRRNFNYTSPTYYDLSDRICTALAEHYKKEKQIFAWQLDNEFNCHMDVSYAPSDTIAWRAWLKEKYRTPAKLNQAWGTAFWSQQYSAWEQIDLPHPTATYLNPSMILDESRFISDCVMRFARRQAEILRRANPKWILTHNAVFGNINGVDLAREVDVLGHDQYPLFHQDWAYPANALKQARSLAFPYWILEQQAGPGGQMEYLHRTPRPGEMRQWAWQSVAHGASLLCYFRWRTCPYGSEQHWHGLHDQDDVPRRRIREARETGAELAKLPRAFVDAPLTRQVAVMRSFDNEVNEWRINTYIGQGRGENGRWGAALAKAHIACDDVWAESDLNGYKLLVLPHLKIVTPELVRRVEAYVRRGGVLLLGAQSGLKDVNGHIVEARLPGLWRRIAGVEIEDWTTLAQGETREFGLLKDLTRVPAISFVERLKLMGAKAAAMWETQDPLLAGAPAVAVNRVGRGRVIYVGAYLSEAAITALLPWLQETCGIAPLAKAGPMVEVIERRAGRKRWVVLNNFADEPQQVSGVAGVEVISGRKVSGEILLDPRGVAVIAAGR